MLNLDPVSALILSVLTAWVQMLSRAMSSCQLLRFICSDLMDQLQTPFSAMSTEGHLRHLHIMGRTMPRLLTATQPDPTYSTYRDWQFLLIQAAPFPTSSSKGNQDSSVLQSVLEQSATCRSFISHSKLKIKQDHITWPKQYLFL